MLRQHSYLILSVISERVTTKEKRTFTDTQLPFSYGGLKKNHRDRMSTGGRRSQF